MTNAPPDRTGTSTDGWEGEAIPDLPIDEVRDLFVTLGKALRAYQLYDENNPVYHRFVSSLREAFQDIWQEVDKVTVAVEEHRFMAGETAVYENENRSESLAFLFFKDGVREITFLSGIETDEMEPFLAVLQRARNLKPDADDLLTVLWEADLTFFDYTYVEVIPDGVELPAATPEGERADLGQAHQSLREEAKEDEGGQAAADSPAPKQISKEDFNPTLYSLDPREKEVLREEVELEVNRELRADVLNALYDRLEDADSERQAEILGILTTLLPNFLSRGALEAAAEVLDEIAKMRAAEGVFDDARKAEVDGLLDQLSSEATLNELIRAIRDGSISADPELLARFLTHLRIGALRVLLRASEEAEDRELRKVLSGAVVGIAEQNPEALLGLLGDSSSVVAAGAARLAGKMGVVDAAPALARLMEHPQPLARLAAVEAASELRAAGAATAIQARLDDPDRSVRIASARALGTLRHSRAEATLKQIVTGKAIRQADLTEKLAVFESYGLVGGMEAVKVLDGLLNGKGFLGRRESAEIRACAARSLGRVGTDPARQALDKAKKIEDPVVRSAVNKALRGEEDES
ncbi:MAG: hypothetical protein BMS9Abin29_1889 [Gemmatimonadota bacterium]|nr:MAG: hypothetical protein BMS9Abin29_1889 [Gemmatimonadota bacterium]